MCILCRDENLTGLKELKCCQHIINIPNIKGLQKLDCSNTQIREIPNIEGLKILDCKNTQIREIPNIKGLQILYCWNTQIREIPNIEGLIKLYCYNTQIREIPNIKGLKELDCDNTQITKIPNIKGCKISARHCHWLNPSEEKLLKVITIQRFIKRYLLGKHFINIIDEVSKVYYMPGCKGFYLSQKAFNG